MREPLKKLTLKDFLEAVDNGLSVLHVDMETSISQFYGFSCGDQYVGHDALVSGTETKIMSIQYKFEGDSETKYLVWDEVEHALFAKLPETVKNLIKKGFKKRYMVKFGLIKFDDTSLLRKFITNILPKAHILVGQNIDGFDFKVLNDRIMLLGLTPIDHELTIDILKLSRQSFRKLSHKLDYRSKTSNLGGKHRMERQDWIDIVEGRVSVLDKMIPYGLKDVDDEQSLMYKEFNYYRKLPAKIQKIIRQFLVVEEKPFCLHCAKIKKPKFNIRAKKLGNVTKYTCLNCEESWNSHSIKVG